MLGVSQRAVFLQAFCLGVAALLAWGTLRVQERLDEVHPDQQFEELLYLPSGTALRLAAFGFESPLADALWLKTLIYYSQNMKGQRDRDARARHLYLHKAFDVITDLNPQFRTAYGQGGLLLSAANQPEPALELLEKGLERFPMDWPMHLNAAVFSMQQLKDMDKAFLHFKAAANCEGVPKMVMEVLPGILAMQAEGSKPEDVLSIQLVGLSATVDDPQTSPQLRAFLREKIGRLRTARLLLWVSDGNRRFHEAQGRWPGNSTELIRSGLGAEALEAELRAFPFIDEDGLLLLEGGEVTSLKTAARAVSVSQRLFRKAVREYEERRGRPPEGVEELIAEKLLRSAPQHPLKVHGYRLRFDPQTRELVEVAP
ncbi:MAG: hypothetical protein ACYTGH_10605 [Planctomycetota bacterium]|jgi:tetratricopeptide (TPR) repeat protein